MTLVDRLAGVIAVVVAPFSDSTGPIAADVATELAARCDRAGIHAVTALGNTAEIHQLDPTERVELLRAVRAGCTQALTIAGAEGSLAELERLATLAAELGYDAVMVHEPPDPFASDRGIRTLIEQLAERSPLPLVLYVRSSRLSADSLARLVEHERVVAVKYAIPSLTEAAALLGRTGILERCRWICGLAESWIQTFLPLGMHGFTSGLANVRPDLALGIWEAAEQRDWAALAEQIALVRPFELMRTLDDSRYNVAVLKSALSWQGLDVGDVRPPCIPLDPESERKLHELLARWPA